MNKLPLMRWTGRAVYVNSTHSILPPRLNLIYDGPGDARLSGALLHGKFLPDIVAKSHENWPAPAFADPDAYAAYHRAVAAGPRLHGPESVRFTGWAAACRPWPDGHRRLAALTKALNGLAKTGVLHIARA